VKNKYSNRVQASVFGLKLDGAFRFGMAACFVGVEGADDLEVFFDVAGGHEVGADATGAAGVIHAGESEGDLRAERHVVETGTPIGGAAARAFGGEDEGELVAGGEGIDDLFDGVLGGAAVDGDTTCPTHEAAEGRLKEGVLADEVE